MKLLNRSIRSYILYAIVILIIAIPVLYLVIQKIVAEEVDEGLYARKEKLVTRLQLKPVGLLPDSVDLLESGVYILPLTTLLPKDSFYTVGNYDRYSDEDIPYRILETGVTINGTKYRLLLKSSLVDSKDLIESIVFVMILLMVLITAGLIIINRAIAKKIWRPFYHALDKLKQYKIEGSESIKLEQTTIDEFNELNSTITSITARNKEVYRSQKEFTENASHEMQTPLAIFQGKLELLMQTTPLNPFQAELIGDLANAGQRLNKLNRSLLLLTKIENNQFPEIENVAVAGVLQRLIGQYEFRLNKQGISLHVKLDEQQVVAANKTLIEILLGNLLSNAIRYSHSNSTIEIAAGEGKLTIRNTGNATALNDKKIFYRFNKNSTDQQSVGLGLAIAKEIADLYQYQLEYVFIEGVHQFSIRF